MTWLQTLDVAVFRFVNHTLSNSILDVVMPFLSGNRFFVPTLVVLGVALLWKGGARGRLLVVVMAVTLACGDLLLTNLLKHTVARPRPFWDLLEVHLLAGKTDSGSMPSGHASNWFAATMVAYAFYRRTWRFMLPLAVMVGLSRIYVGVHYPSDVLAGAIIGAGYAATALWLFETLWQRVGPAWFPEWWKSLPSVLDPRVHQEISSSTHPSSAIRDLQWVRLGYLLIAALLLFRLGYIASGVIELEKDEAYQWLWSKHLALSYFSKPPGIALIQFVGTSLWGDTQFGIRFFSPVFAAVLSIVVLRFMAREVSGRAGFLLLLIVTCTPLLSLGTILLTIDPPLVLCWTLAMIAGWRAAQPEGTTKHWLLVGAAMGLGFLCKYSAAYQLVCWAIFFALWPPARAHLRRPGPYLAMLLFAVCTLPVFVWNAQHGWITVRHVSENAGLVSRWKPTLRYSSDFLFLQFGLLNPVFFVGAVWAMVAFWPRRRTNPLWLYFFCLGAPVFLGHWIYSLHSRIQPNWVAPAVLPMFCLMVAYWDARWREGLRSLKGLCNVGLILGLAAVVLMHETNFISKIFSQPLPPEMDPLRRVRAWKETAATVENARQKLLQEGKPAFIISDHYGMTGLFTFYLPEARTALPAQPLVYCQTAVVPENQFFFWPEYRYREHRQGENAIYFTELDPYPLEVGWFWKWLAGKPVAYDELPPTMGIPELLRQEFQSVADLGVQEVKLRERVFRRVHLFACRNLR